ncbi:uncharacterized protein LOC112595709 [Melanaphis sacchari]|uniref:uncharacterized protein LOC112595709 n=1 Tax=Melanaphis sacchari TaxID=742174 RepID=UPI000DC1441B|nr:uncharacterized protein LOC112595709 [Melanaphis sacchari]
MTTDVTTFTATTTSTNFSKNMITGISSIPTVVSPLQSSASLMSHNCNNRKDTNENCERYKVTMKNKTAEKRCSVFDLTPNNVRCVNSKFEKIKKEVCDDDKSEYFIIVNFSQSFEKDYLTERKSDHYIFNRWSKIDEKLLKSTLSYFNTMKTTNDSGLPSNHHHHRHHQQEANQHTDTSCGVVGESSCCVENDGRRIHIILTGLNLFNISKCFLHLDSNVIFNFNIGLRLYSKSLSGRLPFCMTKSFIAYTPSNAMAVNINNYTVWSPTLEEHIIHNQNIGYFKNLQLSKTRLIFSKLISNSECRDAKIHHNGFNNNFPDKEAILSKLLISRKRKRNNNMNLTTTFTSFSINIYNFIYIMFDLDVLCLILSSIAKELHISITNSKVIMPGFIVERLSF